MAACFRDHHPADANVRLRVCASSHRTGGGVGVGEGRGWDPVQTRCNVVFTLGIDEALGKACQSRGGQTSRK